MLKRANKFVFASIIVYSVRYADLKYLSINFNQRIKLLN